MVIMMMIDDDDDEYDDDGDTEVSDVSPLSECQIISTTILHKAEFPT